jgi:hypothetical protein
MNSSRLRVFIEHPACLFTPEFGTHLAMCDHMQGQATTNRINLLICQERCSEAFRELAARHNWTLLEGIGADPALHACVAIEPDRVCVELVNAARMMPDLVRRLASLDSVACVGCLVPALSRSVESSLAGFGATVLSTIEEAEDWLAASEHEGEFAPQMDNRFRTPRFLVQRRTRLTERSVFPCE